MSSTVKADERVLKSIAFVIPAPSRCADNAAWFLVRRPTGKHRTRCTTAVRRSMTRDRGG